MADKPEHKMEHTSQPPPARIDEDSDPDFDDLDDVLDQFSANAPAVPPPITSTSTSAIQSQPSPAPSSSGPGRPGPTDTSKPLIPDPLVPSGPKQDESEDAFLARLQLEMSKMFSQLPSDPEVAAKSPEDMAKIGKELEEFTLKMEEQGIKPEDLLKAILGQEEGGKIADIAHEVRDSKEAEKAETKGTSKKSQKAAGGSATTTTGKQTTSFDDTIRRTMSRLNESDSQAKNATSQASNKSEEDMLAEMLKALSSGGEGGEGSDDGVSKMFTDMMHQLTHKDMLYEPMKELNDQYPDWLRENKPPKTSQDEYARYEKQATIVRDIVSKFEEKDYKDEDERCREYIWNHMQSMQELGAPPSQLVSSPFGPGTEFGDIPGLGGGGADQEGCSTQ